MKRFFILMGMALFCVSGVFAVEETLIDFAELIDDYQGENKATIIDFSTVAGTTYTDEEKAAMKTSLFVPNWEVELASSSSTVENNRYSYIKAVQVKDDATKFAGEQILGVRIHFPEGAFNSYALIKPPFTIPGYATSSVDEEAVKGGQFDNYGVVKNVGVIKSIKVNVLGRNFPNGFGLIIRDENNNKKMVFMTYLDFDGWRELQWNNPNYITDVRNRELRQYPLYPKSAPSVALESLVFFKDSQQEGGDFVSYVKDVKVVFDNAIRDDIDSDVNDEDVWGILADREESRRNAELQRLGHVQVLRYLESKKMDKSDEEEENTEAETATE